MIFNNHTVHVIDFEGSTQCGIIEYGVATLEKGKLVGTHTRLCQAKGKIAVADSKMHGIKGADVEDLPPFSSEWELFSTLRQTGPLAAHYAAVENRLLKQEWPYPSESPDFINPKKIAIDWGPWIDTCQLYRLVYPQLESYKLSDLIAQFELQTLLDQVAQEHAPIKRCRYHCALYDALASALLLQHLGQLPGYENITLAWLLTQSFTAVNERRDKQQGELEL